MIRHATHADIPAMVELGLAMLRESPVFSRLDPSVKKIEQACRNAIDGGMAFVVEHQLRVVGGMLAIAVPHWASDDRVACDLALFVHPDYRGTTAAARLLRAYAEWASAQEVKFALFGVNTGLRTTQVVALAQACGYHVTGSVLEAPHVL
jgi:GNAT superfamily N-acetyltransferase